MHANAALAGLKILDFTRIYSGPYCTMLLADFGAEVIKIEEPALGDQTRSWPPQKQGVSGYFNYLNRNKKSIALDLKSEAGKKAVFELVAWADVVVENFSAGTMDKLGFGYEDCKKVNPEIIYVAISGFGQYGPYKNKLAFDIIAQAMGGLLGLSGTPERAIKTTPAISDAIAGIHAACAVMVAAYHKQATGRGQMVDIGMMDAVFSVLESSVVIKTLDDREPKRMGTSSEVACPYDSYAAKDGDYIVCCPSDPLFVKLAKVMGREDMLTDPRYSDNAARLQHRDAVDAIVQEWVGRHTKAELEGIMDATKIPNAPIKTIGDLVNDPHIAAREMLIENDDPIIGKCKYPGNPLKLSNTPANTAMRAPGLGEHTAQILRDVLQYSQKGIDEVLSANGA